MILGLSRFLQQMELLSDDGIARKKVEAGFKIAGTASS